jgi:hypothetical protein
MSKGNVGADNGNGNDEDEGLKRTPDASAREF